MMSPRNQNGLSKDADKNWPQEEKAVANKPLVSILDLGKLLLQYSRDGDVAKVQELIVKGAPFNTDWLGMTPLHYAAKGNNIKICDLLLRGGINKDAKTKVDRTALHYAVYEGNQEVVELLLSRNVDINAKDMLRMTALHWAVEKRHKNIARLLVKHGADVCSMSKFDKTPVTIAFQTGQPVLLKELEAAQDYQCFKLVADIPENQIEMKEAVNSISMETLNMPKFENLNSALGESDSLLSSDSTQGTYKNTANITEKNVNVKNDNEQTETAMELLKHHGITMIPTDEPRNLLDNALERGRKLVLSEAGKLVLNNSKQKRVVDPPKLIKNEPRIFKRISHNSFLNLNRHTPILLPARPQAQLRNNKNVKIITMDMFKKMYGGDLANSKKDNSNIPNSRPKLVELIKEGSMTSRKTILHKHPENEETPSSSHLDNSGNQQHMDDLPSNIIEVCSESEAEEDICDTSWNPVPSNFAKYSNSQSPTHETNNIFQVLDVAELSRQIQDLRKQTHDLRTKIELTEKQNEIYRIRLELLEKRKEK